MNRDDFYEKAPEEGMHRDRKEMESLTILDESEIEYSISSNVDDLGRVFFYQGKVFRAIRNSAKEYCLRFLNSTLFQELISSELIPATRRADFRLENHDLILEHEFIQPSKPHHWSFSMVKDAALLVFRLNRICNKHGYELKDAHPYNVFFKFNRPIFVDIGSIIKIGHSSRWVRYVYAEFACSFYLQLRLWSQSEIFFARRLLEDGLHAGQRTIPNSKVMDSSLVRGYFDGIFDYGLFWRGRLVLKSAFNIPGISLVQRAVNAMASRALKRSAAPFEYLKIPPRPDLTEKRIKRLSRPLQKTMWGNYHDISISTEQASVSSRFARIIHIIEEKTPDIQSVVDLAGNQGSFCYSLVKKMNLDRIILTDYDENAIDRAYQLCRREGLAVQPYVLNFMFLMRLEEAELFRSDMAVALAITHHLILTQGYSLSAIFDMIGRFSNKYVVIEFMPFGLWSKGPVPQLPDWYHVEWFREEFNKHFKLLAEESLEKNRIVFVGKK